MKWIIDGYNLIGATPSLSLRDPDKEHQLCCLLEQVMGTAVRQVVLVFDSQQDHWAETHVSRVKSIHVIYTSPGHSADDEIIKRLNRSRSMSRTVVVTSDQHILSHAKRSEITVIKSENFWYDCKRRFHSKQDGSVTPPKMGEREMEYWLRTFGEDHDR